LLAIIVVAITMGCLITAPAKSVLMKAIVELEVMIVKIIDFVIRLTPIGVFSLVLANLLTTDLFKLGGYFVYLISTTMIGLCFHFLFVYPSIYAVIVRKNPFQYIKGCLPAHLTGFGTASSAATMPVTLSCLKNMGIPQSVSQFTIPLGTTINMDGIVYRFI
jgi:Na+/H+-dicarboxylate symporter